METFSGFPSFRDVWGESFRQAGQRQLMPHFMRAVDTYYASHSGVLDPPSWHYVVVILNESRNNPTSYYITTDPVNCHGRKTSEAEMACRLGVNPNLDA